MVDKREAAADQLLRSEREYLRARRALDRARLIDRDVGTLRSRVAQAERDLERAELCALVVLLVAEPARSGSAQRRRNADDV